MRLIGATEAVICQQKPVAIQKRLDESYPGTAKRAANGGAAIHWVDETALVNTDVRGGGCAHGGKTAVVRVARRFR